MTQVRPASFHAQPGADSHLITMRSFDTIDRVLPGMAAVRITRRMVDSAGRGCAVAHALLLAAVIHASPALAQGATRAPPCSEEDARVAAERFASTDAAFDALPRTLSIAPGPQPTGRDFVLAMRAQLDAAARSVRRVTDPLVPVRLSGCGPWSVLADSRSAEAYSLLARAIDEATLLPLPDDMRSRLDGAPAATVAGVEAAFLDQMRTVLRDQSDTVRCFMIASDLRASRAARIAGMNDPAVSRSLARLRALEPRIAACVVSSPGMEPYRAGELEELAGSSSAR